MAPLRCPITTPASSRRSEMMVTRGISPSVTMLTSQVSAHRIPAAALICDLAPRMAASSAMTRGI